MRRKIFTIVSIFTLMLFTLTSCIGRPVMPGTTPGPDPEINIDDVVHDMTSSSLLAALPVYSNKSKTEAQTTEEMFVSVADYGRRVAVMVNVYSNKQLLGSGSGVIYSKKDSYFVLTNDHVVNGADSYTIKTNQEDDLPATLIGTSPTYDVAVLTFDSDVDYDVVDFEDDDVSVGQYCVAIGTPLDQTFFNTVTVGNVSLTNNEQVMHTASINSGNSGGPLLNSKGNLIGLNNSKLSGNTSSGASIDDMYFAISLENIQKAIKEINSPKLGITTVNVESILTVAQYNSYNEAYYALQISRNDYNAFKEYASKLPSNVTNGVFIINVNPGSSADEILFINDVVVEVEGILIEDVYTIKNILTEKKIGDSITFKVYRSGEVSEKQIILK